jgi:hypothetical protein
MYLVIKWHFWHSECDIFSKVLINSLYEHVDEMYVVEMEKTYGVVHIPFGSVVLNNECIGISHCVMCPCTSKNGCLVSQWLCAHTQEGLSLVNGES